MRHSGRQAPRQRRAMDAPVGTSGEERNDFAKCERAGVAVGNRDVGAGTLQGIQPPRAPCAPAAGEGEPGQPGNFGGPKNSARSKIWHALVRP